MRDLKRTTLSFALNRSQFPAESQIAQIPPKSAMHSNRDSLLQQSQSPRCGQNPRFVEFCPQHAEQTVRRCL